MEKIEITPKGFQREADKLTAEQLDAPIDEVVGEPTPESVPEAATEPEPKEEPTPAEEQAQENPEPEEEKVPKSRFRTVHQRAVEAEKRLRQLEAELEEREEPEEPIADDETIRKHYVDIFGENELTDKLYKAELSRLRSLEERAAERAFERLSQREEQEQQVIEQRVESFDQAFEELSALEGKDFTDDEQVGILDIVDEFSPKDERGRIYADYLMPLDKAYEIYQMRTAPKAQAKKQERNAVAALTNARSEGTPTGSSDADWQPNQDRRWWNKVQ